MNEDNLERVTSLSSDLSTRENITQFPRLVTEAETQEAPEET